MAQCCTTRHYAALHGTTRHYAALRSTTQHYAALCGTTRNYVELNGPRWTMLSFALLREVLLRFCYRLLCFTAFYQALPYHPILIHTSNQFKYKTSACFARNFVNWIFNTSLHAEAMNTFRLQGTENLNCIRSIGTPWQSISLAKTHEAKRQASKVLTSQ